MDERISLKHPFILCLTVLCVTGWGAHEPNAYFADGYHGGIYGHYPMWQAKFMVDKLQEYPHWKINLEIEPETWDRVVEQDAENFNRLQDYYAQIGRFGRIEFVNPAYAQPYAYNISGESLIRHFIYGMAKIRQYFPDATFETYSCEEPCFTSCMPQVLTSLGYEHAVLRNPDTCWGGYTSGYGKDLVYWKGSDGSFVLAVPRYACEVLEEGSTWQTESWDNSKSFIKGCLDNGVQYPVGMCFQDAGWRGGPWLENAIRDYYEPSLYVTWTDYIKMIAPKVTPDDWDLSIEDVKPGLVWGAQVLQKLAQEIRVTENRLIQAEKIAAMDWLFHGTVYPQAELDEAWRGLMLSQHHDCWIVPYNGRPGQTWADKVTRWTSSANRIADQIIQSCFDHLRDQPTEDPGVVTVFNTLGAPRTDCVSIELPEGLDSHQCQVRDPQGNRVQAQATATHQLMFRATTPPMGYTTYQLVREPQSPGTRSVKMLDSGMVQVETPYYNAKLDPKRGGTITSLFAKQMGNVQLVESGKGLNGLSGHLYDEKRFVRSAESEAKVSVVEDGAFRVRLRIDHQWAGHPLQQTVTFYQHHPRIDCRLNIDWQGQPGIGAYSQRDDYRKEDRAKAFYNDKYKLHIQFPLAAVGGKLFKNAPFDVCQSQLENTFYDRWDQIKHNVILNWVDVTDPAETLGVALFSDHTTSYLQSDELVLGLTVQYVGKGLWGRNYRIHGPTHIKYALLPHSGSWEQAQIEAESRAWNEPLIGRWMDSASNPASKSLLEANRDLGVSSVTVNDNDLLVRFFNVSSKGQKQEVRWHCNTGNVEQVNLLGNVISPVQPVTTANGASAVKLSIPQFGLRTLRLELARVR